MTRLSSVWAVRNARVAAGLACGWLGAAAQGVQLLGCAQFSASRGAGRAQSPPPAALAPGGEALVRPAASAAPSTSAQPLPPTPAVSAPAPSTHYDAAGAGPPTFPTLDLGGRTYGVLDRAATPDAATLIDLGDSKAAIARDIERAWPEQMLRLVNDDGSTCTATVEGTFRVVQSAVFDDNELAQMKKQGMSDGAIALRVFESGSAMNALRVLPSAECRGTPLVMQSLSEPAARALTEVSVPSLEADAIEFARALAEFKEIDTLYRETVLDAPLEAGEAAPEQNWEDVGGYAAQAFASADGPRYVRITVDSGFECSRWHVWRGVLLEVTPNTAPHFRIVASEVGNAMRFESSVDFLADLDGSGMLIARLSFDDTFTFVDDRWPGTRDWSLAKKGLCPC